MNPRPPQNKKPPIKGIIIIGDSASDRGTLFRNYLLRILSGVDKYSRWKRFANGYIWSDHFGAILANRFFIKQMHKKGYADAEIADALIHNEKNILAELRETYSLANDQLVSFKRQIFVRTYCEGGTTAHSYFFSKMMLPTLNGKVSALLKDDKLFNIPLNYKEKSLVIEWTGANDLVTVNKPTLDGANKAINARTENIERLIAAGYKHFLLFNLPDLASTPLFHAKSEKERENVAACTLILIRISGGGSSTTF